MAYAGAALAHDGHEGGVPAAVILESLSQAHAKLDAGDRPGAKADLKELAAKLKGDPTPANRAIRRKVQFIVIELTVGYVAGAEKLLHRLIKEISESGATPPPADDGPPPPDRPGSPPAPVSAPPDATPASGPVSTLDHGGNYDSYYFQRGYRDGYHHGYRDGYYHHGWNPYHDASYWTRPVPYRRGYLQGYDRGYRQGAWNHGGHNPAVPW